MVYLYNMSVQMNMSGRIRLVVYICLTAILAVGSNVYAHEGDVAELKASQYISTVYKQINFSESEQLDYYVFVNAMTGYMNLKAENKLSTDKDILTVCDYSLSANNKRMWVIDLRSKTILLNTYVAHGQGTGEEYATRFSNNEGSHQSSLGFYVTGTTYTGKHGNSMYLHGMDEGYNSAAYKRAIVVHGAGYVSSDFIAGTGRLGRSWGCPAVSNDVSEKLIDMTKEGTCLFIYYPEQKYLASSPWLRDVHFKM